MALFFFFRRVYIVGDNINLNYIVFVINLNVAEFETHKKLFAARFQLNNIFSNREMKLFRKKIQAAKVEAKEDKKKRWRSIKILYMTMFFDSLSFSIVLASIYPYMVKIDSNITPIYVGWANIGFQLGGILVDFFMGYLTNKLGSTIPLLLSLIFFGFGNLFYGYAQSCGKYGIPMVIFSRTIIGLSTGTNVVARAVAAEATTLKERTKVMSRMSVAQGLGFSFGPIAQLLAVPLGHNGVDIPALKIHLNVYTAPAFASIFVTALNVVVVLFWYNEHQVDIYKDQENDTSVQIFKDICENNNTKLSRNTTGIIVNIIVYFAVQNAFAVQETILAPLSMDMFSWNGEQATLWVSCLFLAAGVIAIVSFIAADLLEKRFNERNLLLLGLVLIFFGFTVYLPWGSKTPLIKGIKTSTNNTLHVGCPAEYKWCKNTPQIYLAQVILGMVLLSIGYPLTIVFISSIYSKVLSSKPQGVMQSFLGASGGLARTVGPSLVTFMYIEHGPRYTFLCANGFILLSMILFIFSYKILIPYHLFIVKKKENNLLFTDESLLENNWNQKSETEFTCFDQDENNIKCKEMRLLS
nr:major facilitator superfamily domain-containing protein 8 [Hydra vulgaris]